VVTVKLLKKKIRYTLNQIISNRDKRFAPHIKAAMVDESKHIALDYLYAKNLEFAIDDVAEK
jgi:hypothetical protein